MKAVLIKARDNFKAGDIVECNAQEFAVLADGAVSRLFALPSDVNTSV